MSRHLLCFATSGNVTGSRARWVQPVEAAWPGGVPDVRALGLDALVVELARAGQGAKFGAALVVFGPAETARTIDRVIEAMNAANLPGVCLVKDPSQWRDFQKHGVIFDGLDADPRMIASMLFALSERQGAVESLSREIAITQRCQGGMRSEMDRMHEELHLAAAVQREFTSAAMPKVEGLEFGVLFRPVNFVSGDIYNVRSLGDGKAAFFMADAVGHGVPAALLTMVLTSSLTTTEAGKVLEPGEVLRQLNERLCASCLGSGRFATALYGVVDAKTREVKLAGAGHPYPVRVSRTGAMEVPTEGPLLGVFPGAEFSQARFELSDGDSLLLYTDGFEMMFPERDDAPEWGGRAYLRELTRMVGVDRDLTQCLAELEGALDEQSGSLHQADDVTAVVISTVRGAGAVGRKRAA